MDCLTTKIDNKNSWIILWVSKRFRRGRISLLHHVISMYGSWVEDWWRSEVQSRCLTMSEKVCHTRADSNEHLTWCMGWIIGFGLFTVLCAIWKTCYWKKCIVELVALSLFRSTFLPVQVQIDLLLSMRLDVMCLLVKREKKIFWRNNAKIKREKKIFWRNNAKIRLFSF